MEEIAATIAAMLQLIVCILILVWLYNHLDWWIIFIL